MVEGGGLPERHERFCGDEPGLQLLGNLQNSCHIWAGCRQKRRLGATIALDGEVEDEYKFLEKRGEWIRVRLEGNTQAWVRSSAVTILAENEKPAGGVDKPAAGAGPSSESAPEFAVVREEVQPFSGDWPPLKGKQALFVFAQPGQIPEGTLGQRQSPHDAPYVNALPNPGWSRGVAW